MIVLIRKGMSLIKIKLDRFKFYNDEKHKDLTVKVKNKKHIVKGIVLIKDKS